MGVRAPHTFGGTVSNGLGGTGSRIPAPATPIAPHLTLPEPLPPPQPEPPEQPRCEPFPSQPPPRDSADSTASQAQHVTSDQRSTAFRAQASGGLAGADGLPEVDVKWMKPSNHCNKPAYTSQEMRRLDRVAMLWRSLETTVFFVAMATNSYS
ncbi:putative histone-lysine N-methyltransferase PRDM6 [Herpailurus yagouaroundi]|uniref:putative histone-lysine N-methyltransferase PRDM6 n=1 Tax=Herpailurus yagouaroundi TaxID=1608482 RepID=UPI001AD6909E|nr:putative histone-lysine N-methyltransferase PRDM6 [Puma yagouaroundi]